MKELKSTVQKTFTLLEHFTPAKPQWGVTELATHMGSHKSTVYRFLTDLEKMGILYKDATLDKYSLGLKLFELGSRVQLRSAFIVKTHPVLEEVAQKIEETVHLAILKNRKAFYVDKAESPKGLKISSTIGSYSPIHATALGKVLLAHVPPEEQTRIVKAAGRMKELVSYTSNTLVQKGMLKKELEKIGQQGYAIDREEYEVGLLCLAIPVFNGNGEVVASLSASGPANRFKEDLVDSYVNILRSGAESIKNKIGLFKPI